MGERQGEEIEREGKARECVRERKGTEGGRVSERERERERKDIERERERERER